MTLVVACALPTGCVQPSDGTPSSADLADFEVQPTIDIVLDDEGFSPDAVDLAANSTIAITNQGTDAHGVVQSGTAVDRRIETGDLVPGETVDIHLADPGAVELTDPHSGASLTLEVGPAAPNR
jgi:LDH2 family malate/lactate/ureidoglycolate dehydrogenase